ncbi:MAG: MFS transporter, partial [Burkholderiales bacterium]
RVVLQLYALDIGASPTEVGILIALYYVCPLLLSWPAGTLGDRHGPRYPLLFSAICGAGGLLVPYFVHTLPALYLAGALSGMSFAFFLVIVQNLVGVLSAPEQRAQMFSNFSLVGATSNFIGPLVAGFSIDNFGYPVACVTAAAFALITGGMVLAWGAILPGGSTRVAPRARIADTLADPAIVRILVIGGLVQLGTDLFSFYIPFYGVGIGLSASAIGALLASFAAASFIVRFALSRLIRRLGEDRLLAYSFYIAAGGFALVPLFHDVVLLCLVSFIFGLGTGCGQPIATMLMFSRAADGRSGEALGLRLTANNFVRVIAPALFGFIVSGFGLAPVFYINALMMGAGGLVSRGKSGT